ncbi:MAG: SDR family oxidoreductase [Candidatus Binataceae bacterium]|jgi:NAD(P)-dependent dehydrogenase (short-subunit alcohol dehydrogenase family)
MSQLHTVVITGAGSGIGRALAAGFTSDGYVVAGLGRTASALEETMRLCKDNLFSYKVADVSDNAAVTAALAQIALEVGPIDVLICNAAVYPRAYFLEQPADEWTHALMINICGVANCCRAVLPAMLERHAGRIVVVGSFADAAPIPASSVYSTSKGALHALTKALSAEIDSHRYPNVLVNEFNPGSTRTAMNEGGHEPAAVYPSMKRLVEFPAGGPTGRIFLLDQEIRPREGLKGRIRNLLLRRR